MQIHFTGRNIDVTPALKTFTEEKLERIKHHHQHIDKIYVTFHIENVTHIAEANVHIDHADIHATARADDMYSAIDLLMDKLVTQINKHKEKGGHH